VFDEDHRLVFISAFPALIGEDKRSAVGEFCNLANLISGQFYTDLPLYVTYRLLPDNRPAGLAPLVTEHMI